jgi:exodeoxyribonuclease VII small subunit
MADSKVNGDIATMSYEQARDELAKVLSDLEAGAVTLEQSMTLWERGEALAKRCEEWLSGARKRVDEALKEK